MKAIKPIFYWIIAVAWMYVIFSLSAKTATESSAQSDGFLRGVLSLLGNSFDEAFIDSLQNAVRKFAHFAEYAVLGMLLSMAIGCHTSKPALRFFISLASGTAYAVTDEIHQLFVPGRASMIKDVLLDGVGVAAGAALVALGVYLITKIKLCKIKVD